MWKHVLKHFYHRWWHFDVYGYSRSAWIYLFCDKRMFPDRIRCGFNDTVQWISSSWKLRDPTQKSLTINKAFANVTEAICQKFTNRHYKPGKGKFFSPLGGPIDVTCFEWSTEAGLLLHSAVSEKLHASPVLIRQFSARPSRFYWFQRAERKIRLETLLNASLERIDTSQVALNYYRLRFCA